MEVLIAVIVAIVIIGIISVFFLLRTGRKPVYSRPSEDAEPGDTGPAARTREVRQARPVKYTSGDGSLTASLISGFRIMVGLAAVVVLVYIFNSTQNALKGVTDNVQITRIYAEGIFKALITIGITSALYIFSKFYR